MVRVIYHLYSENANLNSKSIKNLLIDFVFVFKKMKIYLMPFLIIPLSLRHLRSPHTIALEYLKICLKYTLQYFCTLSHTLPALYIQI